MHLVRSGWGRMGQLRSPPGTRLCALRGAGRFPQHGAQFCSVSTASCAPTTEMKYRRTCCPAEILRLTSVHDTVVKVTFFLRGVTTATPQDQDFLHSENRSRLPCAALRVLRYLGKQQGVGAPCPLLCSDSLALLTLPLLTVCH